MATVERTLAHPANYDWQPQPRAQALLDELVIAFLTASPFAANLARRMKDQTGTRFFDWIDFIQAPASKELEAGLRDCGFTYKGGDGVRLYEHDGALFPQVALADVPHTHIGIKVDSVSDFTATWGVTVDTPIEGAPYAPVRRVVVARDAGATLWAVERRGSKSFEALDTGSDRASLAVRHFEAFRRRRRDWPTDRQAWQHANELVDAAVAELGQDYACDTYFRAERDYWQRRNRAGRVQKARQDELGLGWANHDHHTYRSSRASFASLVALLEKLGFICRERFYAGADAGWGAQVLEQPECRFVIFADVDLSEEELSGDFAHEGLKPRGYLGTVGLWAALHGESMLQAGMHHLECQFDHESLRQQLQSAGISTMPPFTTLPFLRQAFTEGERWPVAEERLRTLVEQELITPAQAEQFRTQGAIGSHLENLERHDGYKGFNQHGVSDIIARTDPRRQVAQEPLGA